MLPHAPHTPAHTYARGIDERSGRFLTEVQQTTFEEVPHMTHTHAPAAGCTCGPGCSCGCQSGGPCQCGGGCS
ncbi:hypothetical protein CTZ27_24250 [Streptomyces griseocarneus]|nr:hypothetical protein CTZ27_24250 [Streptomyces griseocarneus]